MSFNGPAPLNIKNHGCGYQGGPCNCAQCITFPHLSYKCIPFQQHLYTHRVRTNVHRTPTNYRELITNTVPIKALPEAAVVASSLSAEETAKLLNQHRPREEELQASVTAEEAKTESWGTGTHESQRGPVTPSGTMLPLATSAHSFDQTKAGDSLKVGTVLNPLDFEYRPPRSRTSNYRSSMPAAGTMGSGAKSQSGLCFSQSTRGIAEAEDVARENCTTMFDPYCATHDGRDRTTRKFGPNATVLKYPRYQNHPETVFKPGYSEWRRTNMQSIAREVLAEPPIQKRRLSEWEKQQRHAEAAEEARVMMNNFSSGINSFKASTLPIGRCRMDLNDIAGQRAAYEYLPAVSTACRFPACKKQGECGGH